MEKDIVDGKIGEVGAYDLEFKSGKLTFKVGVSHGVGVQANVEVSADKHLLIAALKKAIPGQVDDVILDLVEKAFDAV